MAAIFDIPPPCEWVFNRIRSKEDDDPFTYRRRLQYTAMCELNNQREPLKVLMRVGKLKKAPRSSRKHHAVKCDIHDLTKGVVGVNPKTVTHAIDALIVMGIDPKHQMDKYKGKAVAKKLYWTNSGVGRTAKIDDKFDLIALRQLADLCG